jgi:hypothetical protein
VGHACRLLRCQAAPSRRSFAATSYTVGSLLFKVWLFRLSEEGIGLTQRLTAAGRVRLPAIRMLTLEPERLKIELVTTSKNWRVPQFPSPSLWKVILVCQPGPVPAR